MHGPNTMQHEKIEIEYTCVLMNNIKMMHLILRKRTFDLRRRKNLHPHSYLNSF